MLKLELQTLIRSELAKAEASHQLPSTTGYNQHFLEGEIYAFNLILNKLNRNKFI